MANEGTDDYQPMMKPRSVMQRGIRTSMNSIATETKNRKNQKQKTQKLTAASLSRSSNGRPNC